MDCEKCENYKWIKRNETEPLIREGCQNFKPKQHPLDKMIKDFLIDYIYEPRESGITMEAELKKLRYESIKHGWNAWHSSRFIKLENYLKNEGHEDWIVK